MEENKERENSSVLS